jgi:uncharacterized membrane protein YphA (DoxX/SURF4 family)
MSQQAEYSAVSKKMRWAGLVISGLVVLMLVFSGIMKLSGSPDVEKEFVRLGWPPNLAIAIGIVELVCVLLYAIPRTSVLGAILLTGYLGGAIAAHVRIEELKFIPPAIGGVLVWLGLYLRNERLRELIPFRR